MLLNTKNGIFKFDFNEICDHARDKINIKDIINIEYNIYKVFDKYAVISIYFHIQSCLYSEEKINFIKPMVYIFNSTKGNIICVLNGEVTKANEIVCKTRDMLILDINSKDDKKVYKISFNPKTYNLIVHKRMTKSMYLTNKYVQSNDNIKKNNTNECMITKQKIGMKLYYQCSQIEEHCVLKAAQDKWSEQSGTFQCILCYNPLKPIIYNKL